jgi:pimeloyl-ACP methyl ester carboxylesterase
VELCVADMAAVLDAQGIDRAVMIGMSLGGFLSLRFAIEHPERVAALVLVDTGPGYKNEEARARWNRYADRMADALETEGHAGLRESPEADRTADPRGLVLAARLIMTQRDDLVITSLPTIGVPTLVIVGELDAPFLDGSRYMAERIPYARLEIIPGAGHAANIDRADLVNDLVADFLHEVDASSR